MFITSIDSIKIVLTGKYLKLKEHFKISCVLEKLLNTMSTTHIITNFILHIRDTLVLLFLIMTGRTHTEKY